MERGGFYLLGKRRGGCWHRLVVLAVLRYPAPVLLLRGLAARAGEGGAVLVVVRRQAPVPAGGSAYFAYLPQLLGVVFDATIRHEAGSRLGAESLRPVIVQLIQRTPQDVLGLTDAPVQRVRVPVMIQAFHVVGIHLKEDHVIVAHGPHGPLPRGIRQARVRRGAGHVHGEEGVQRARHGVPRVLDELRPLERVTQHKRAKCANEWGHGGRARGGGPSVQSGEKVARGPAKKKARAAAGHAGAHAGLRRWAAGSGAEVRWLVPRGQW